MSETDKSEDPAALVREKLLPYLGVESTARLAKHVACVHVLIVSHVTELTTAAIFEMMAFTQRIDRLLKLIARGGHPSKRQLGAVLRSLDDPETSREIERLLPDRGPNDTIQ